MDNFNFTFMHHKTTFSIFSQNFFLYFFILSIIIDLKITLKDSSIHVYKVGDLKFFYIHILLSLIVVIIT